jgi:glyoxylase-like metal-dependent hydrolase (beta-lactamase superfamily II)
VLQNQVWQPLPGIRQAEIYPYLRKPDLLSSNSCVIRTPRQILLIDAGALAAQTADLNRILAECQRERTRPVVVYLTHCHLDHSLEVGRHRQIMTAAPVWIAVQEQGADYLSLGDPAKTIAELYGVAFPSLRPDIRLLTETDKRRKAPRSISLQPGVNMRITTEAIATDLKEPLFQQTISIGGGDVLELYSAPGHSPDSVCIRVGEILFIGDLLAAANPMVAGIAGWHREHLLDTQRHVQWLLDHQPITLCYPGHGGLIPSEKARDILGRLQRKTLSLGDVSRMNEERLFQITDYALELIDEAEEVFSSIAGRLLYVAYQLERLEEEEAACRCRDAMPMERIDACLLEFRKLCRRLESGKIRRVEFAHGALAIVEQIKGLFDPRPLTAILPQPMIHRGTSLLLDFIGIANGRRNLEEFIPTDVNAVIDDVLRAGRETPHLDASVLDYVEDEARFLAALVLRIGHEPAAARPPVHFLPHKSLPYVSVAPGRFSDTLLTFLDWLAQTHPPSIRIATGMHRGGPFVTIAPAGWGDAAPTPHRKKKIDSFARRFRMCGLVLHAKKEGFRLTLAEGPDAADVSAPVDLH